MHFWSLLSLLFYIVVLLVIGREVRRCWLARKYPPGPWGLPILGYLAFIGAHAPHKTLTKLAQKYGALYSLRLGNVDAVVLADVALVREFLKHEEFTARAPLYVTHGIMGGYGLVSAEGALWKEHRRHSIDWLKALGMTKKPGDERIALEQRIRQGVDECVQWFGEEVAQGRAFNPKLTLQHTLGNVLNELVFGLNYARDDVTWNYFQELQEKGLQLIGISGVVNFLPLLRYLPANKRTISYLLKGKELTHEIYQRIIDQRLEQRMTAALKTGEVFMEKTCILDHFIDERYRRQRSDEPLERVSAEELYSDEQLRHLLADLWGAGVDTSLCSLSWLLLYLAKWPKCQQHVRMELSTIASDNFTLVELEQCHYLRACIAEVQRIRSVVPLGIPHGAVKDFQICGYTIPKGCMIIPLQWAIHMDPKLWPEPELYRPARFLNAQGEFQQPPHLIPFQTGKRMCPGDELARMVLLLFAGCILRNFEWKLAPGYENIDMDGEKGITLSPQPYKLIAVHLQETAESKVGGEGTKDAKTTSN